MNRKYYKIILLSLILLAIIYSLCFAWWLNYQKSNDKSSLIPKRYDITIENYNKLYEGSADNPSSPYELPYIKIKNISFASDKIYLYIKYKLGGNLPDANSPLPKHLNDQINSIFFKLYLDENYFDSKGNKNPGGPEAELLISFYGDKVDEPSNKIHVQGELLKGGPGFDYFVIRYPYNQILLNQNSPEIVFSSYSTVATSFYPSGATFFNFSNPLLAATPQNSKEIKADLSTKISSSPTIEDAKY